MRRFILLTTVFLLLFSACKSKKDSVGLIDSSLTETVSATGNMSFSFDKDLAADSIIFVWDSTQYITFSPPIEGLFKWTDNGTLIFSPKNSLAPATAYKASFNKTLADLTPVVTSVDIDPISFQTALLSLNNSSLYWKLEESSKESVAMLELAFNYKVTPDVINKYVQLESDGKTLEYVVLENNESYLQSLLIQDVAVKDLDYVINLNLKKGSKPENGSIGTENDFAVAKLLKSPFQLSVNEINSDHNGTEGIIEIITSQGVSGKDLSNYIEFTPKVKFTTEKNNKGFTVKSKGFNLTTKYEVVVKKGLMGEVGGKLDADFKQDIAFGELEPNIYFDHDKGFYLTGKGYQNISAKIINMKEVRVRVSKLYESNILAAGSYGSYRDYWYDGYDYYNTQMEDVIFEKTYQTSKLEKAGEAHLLKMDFEDKLKDFPGIYHIEIQSTEDYWLRDSRLISVSDIGLIVKQGQNKLLVFTNSIKTSNAIGDVKLKLYARNNQLIGEGVTNGEGVATIQLTNKEYSGFRPSFLSATKGDDYTILKFNNTQVHSSRYDVGGYRAPDNGLQTYIYFERDIYRPGETVNVATIVRNQNWQSPGSLPVKIEIRMPNGKTLKTFKKNLNNEGSFDVSFPTEANNVTGRYSVYVFSSTEVLLASKSVMVEEFMPDRIKVTTAFSKEELVVDDETALLIDAQNLFGTPAANRNYEVELSYKRKYFNPEGFNQYTFNIANTTNYFDKDLREGTTDDNGQGREVFEVPTDFANMGVLQADVFTTVFDETGRPVNRRNVLEVFTQEHLYGIGYFGYYLNTNAAMDIPLVAVDKDGKAQSNIKARVQVVKHEYKSVLNKNGSSFRYESVPYERELSNKIITLNGKSNFSFTPVQSGRYEVRVYDPEVKTKYVSRHFYSYGYGSTQLSSFEVDNEGKIDIELDKESYSAGQSAKILFTTPFQGRLLVTVEGDEVLEHFYVNTDKRSAEVSLELTDRYIPNVYVTATLFKAHEATEFPLTVAHGFKSIEVLDDKRELNVSIEAPEESRSRTKQTITVKGAPNSKMSIAVVDEGILQVSGYKTPQPYDYFYQKRALRVKSYDVYPYLFPELSGTSAGGGGYDLEKRVNPMKNNRVKLVSFWSGLIETNGSGKASFDIDIPQFSGKLRVMAVNHKGNSFGSNEAYITVADPIILSSTIPRFMSPGDTTIIITNLTNTTKNSANAKASITVEGPFEIVSSSKASAKIGSKAENQVTFKVVAKKEIGSGKIVVKCNALGEDFTEVTEMTVRPASPLLKETGAGTIKAGNSGTINMSQDKFITTSTDYKLVVSKNPMVEFGKDLDYLVRYPYGCTEQTVSAAFPQIYFNDLLISMYRDDSKAEETRNNVDAAITKLKLRQVYNGGLTMWGSGKENWWVTAYAAHFLVEAKNAGFDFDESLLDACLGYLEKRLQSKETVDYYYNRTERKRIAPKEVPYSLYVLALANQPDVSLMNYYKSKTTMLSMDGKYLLAAAYALSGDKPKATELLPNSFSGEKANRQFGGSFASPVRDEAIALNALIEIDPDHEQIGTMVKHISSELKNNRYLNTQDRIFSLLALGKIAKRANNSNIAATITANGKQIGSYEKGVATFTTDQLQDNEIAIKTSGSGVLYYFWEAEGISKDGSYKEEDSYLKVRKIFYDRYGNKLNSNTFKQNDLVVIKLSVNSSYNGTVENVVVTDVIPAGFEIENPRTDAIPGTEWITNQTYPDHRDIRDDRINLFDDIYSGNTQDYYYVVRAVSVGTFQMGPAAADAMYNSEYHSYNGGGTIKVTK